MNKETMLVFAGDKPMEKSSDGVRRNESCAGTKLLKTPGCGNDSGTRFTKQTRERRLHQATSQRKTVVTVPYTNILR